MLKNQYLQELSSIRWQIINGFSLFAFVIYTIGQTYIIFRKWMWGNPNAIYFSRTSTVPGDFGNHGFIFLITLCAIWLYISFQYLGVKGSKPLNSKYEGFFALILTGMMIPSIHELEWTVTYLAVYGYTPLMLPKIVSIIPPNVTSLWLITGPIFLGLYLFFFRRDTKMLKFLVFFAGLVSIFYLFWGALGFPITLAFTGPTQYFWSIAVNGIGEIGSWVWAAAMFFVAWITGNRQRKS